MLKRYWVIVYSPDRFGPKNIGVTAFSKNEAILLINEALAKIDLTKTYPKIDETTEAIENIDINLLDQHHVIPNMGVVTRKGVWFPNLNY